MRIMLGNWKYIFKNLWYVLPHAIVPAVFLALSLDYTAIAAFMKSFFAGDPTVEFVEMFRVLSIVRVNSVLGGVYSVLAVASIIFFAALLLTFVEKHLRIGKRTLNGILGQFGNMLLPTALITLLFTALYELWAVVLSAVFVAVSSISSAAAVYVLETIAFLLSGFVLIFLVGAFYLWLPCMQITGFRPYDALIYSYRLASTVRRQLVLALAISLLVANAILAGVALLPFYVFLPVAFVVYLFLFLSFVVKMETAYFATDKLDREDLIRSYREL